MFLFKAKYELLHKGKQERGFENYDKAIMFKLPF